MRLVMLLFVLMTTVAVAQEQERKLVDRVLRPDMSLENSAQTKQFSGDREALTKRAPTRSFYTQDAARQKEFGGQRSFFARLFHSGPFSRGKQPAELSSRSLHPEHSTTFATQSSVAPRRAIDQTKSENAAGFSGARPFLDRGKTQKALDQHRKQMTVEEVRELLNRNK